ncbi:MAG: hypothetical protein Q9176_006236 [Flavoplaca citrina]
MKYPHTLFLILLHLFGLPIHTAAFQKSGNYFLSDCGSGPGSKAAQLQEEIPQYKAYLQLVLADLHRVKYTQISKAYRAFFKSRKNAARVERVFKNLAEGALVRLPVKGRAKGRYAKGIDATYPEVMCLDENHPQWKTQGACDGHSVGVMPPFTEVAIMCPLFFELHMSPDARHCPRVKHNTFSPDNHLVSYNRFAVFVHEFAHAYVPNWDVENEVMRPGPAVALSAEKSRMNPQNYALYASSEWCDSRGFSLEGENADDFGVVIVANCTHYVDPGNLRDEH